MKKDKELIKTRCEKALIKLRRALKDIEATIDADCPVRFSWEDEQEAHIDLKLALSEWNTFLGGIKND